MASEDYEDEATLMSGFRFALQELLCTQHIDRKTFQIKLTLSDANVLTWRGGRALGMGSNSNPDAAPRELAVSLSHLFLENVLCRTC
jgi:hypothetical protein